MTNNDRNSNGDETPDSNREPVAAGEEYELPDDHWPERDAEPERPTTDESKIGRWAAKAIATVPKPLLGVRGTLFKRLAVKSIENYHKTAGGDAIGINAQAGQRVALEPILYKSPEECEEGEQPGWHVKGRDKVWHPGSEGNSVNYLGRTPVVNLEDDAHVESGWLAPRIGEAIALDNYRPVFTNAQINAVVDGVPASANGTARADGGANMEFELEAAGVFSGDNLIDLDSGTGYDGMRISAAKAREWQAESADSEQMQLQDDRAFMRGMMAAMNDDDKRYILYALVFVLLALAIMFIAPELLSGGGGGGGFIPTLMVSGLGG